MKLTKNSKMHISTTSKNKNSYNKSVEFLRLLILKMLRI